MSGSEVVRVALVTGSELHAQGLSRLLSDAAGIEAVFGLPQSARLSERLTRLSASVAVLDLGLASNLATARGIRFGAPGVRLVALDTSDFRDAVAYARAGVLGLLGPTAGPGELTECLLAAANGDTYFAPRAAAIVWRHFIQSVSSADRAPILTKREREILGMVAADLQNREIAEKLCIELSTVKNHVHSILRKLDVRSRTEAAQMWRALELPSAEADSAERATSS